MSEEQTQAEIERVREAAIAAFNSGDSQAFQAELTDDVILDPWTGPAVSGKAGADALFEQMLAHSEFTARYEIDEIVVMGEWAFDRGNWYEHIRRRATGETLEAVFGTLQLYRREGAQWKIARLIWNLTSPQQGPLTT